MANQKVTLKRVTDTAGSTDNIYPTTDWDQVENKPSTFTPTAHEHSGSDITSGTIATARLGSGTADNTTFLRGDNTWATVQAGSSNPTFEILDSAATGNLWYRVARVNLGSGGVTLRGVLNNHVESFGTQKLNISIFGREGDNATLISVDGTFEVAHPGVGVRVLRTTLGSPYAEYDVYIKTVSYTQAKIEVIPYGSTIITLSDSPLTSEPSGNYGVEFDNTSVGEGAYYVGASIIRNLWHQGNFTPSSYVAKAGDTMTGILNMASNDLVFEGSDPGDIVFKDGTGTEIHRVWSGTNTLNYRTNAGTTYELVHTGNIGSQSVNYATSAGSAPLLSKLPDYTWSASTNPRDYADGLQVSFVQGANGFPEYGTVITAHTYPDDGGTLQLYTPYSDSMGGAGLKYRRGLYNNAGWTPFYKIWSEDNDGSGSGLDADLLDGRDSASYMYYRGISTSGDFQTFQSTAGIVRFDQVNDTNNLSNKPPGYTYGGVASFRGDNFGFQLWGSHTGDFYFKTQWDNDNNQYGGWRAVINSGNIGSQSVNYATSAGSVAWDNVSSKPSDIMFYQGFQLDANSMASNATGFTYSVNAPATGPIARFSTGGGYDLWLNAPYGGGNELYFRTRNGDNGTLNPWRRTWHDGNLSAVTTDNNTSLNSDSRNTQGVTRLYRRDDNSDFSIQHHWTGSHWHIRGYNGDNFHAEARVGYADSTGYLNGTWDSSGRNYSREWIEFPNHSGLYSPQNGAHFYPNNASYGAWRIAGSRNGWGGLEFDSSTGGISLMIASDGNTTGLHANNYGWQTMWQSGTMYVFKNTYGGGTQARVWDGVNLTFALDNTTLTITTS
jgi:hypothetical protein